ncbi:hypothetical protein RIF29_38924 [Crotalaria pallida]|uniref:SPX domain-containing protein n=1 Tax=Crotalaria pallida TaxID=3830 RepID=A0AAN9E216_CROPI
MFCAFNFKVYTLLSHEWPRSLSLSPSAELNRGRATLSRRQTQPSELPSPFVGLNRCLTHSPAYLFLPIKHTHKIFAERDEDDHAVSGEGGRGVAHEQSFTVSTASRFKSATLQRIGSSADEIVDQNYQQNDSMDGLGVDDPIQHKNRNRHHEDEAHNNHNTKYPMEILENVKVDNALQSPMSTIKNVFTDSNQDELSFNKEELRKIEEQLRLVFIEFYQKLLHLKEYSFMNISAFSKIMKKYEQVSCMHSTCETYVLLAACSSQIQDFDIGLNIFRDDCFIKKQILRRDFV